jgi:hypothetical protein
MVIELTDYTRPTRLGNTTTMSTVEIRGALTFRRDPGGRHVLDWRRPCTRRRRPELVEDLHGIRTRPDP